MAYAWKEQWLSMLGCHSLSKQEWNLMLLRCWFYLSFQRQRILITCIFVFFQFGGNRFCIFHVSFSADVKQNCLTSKSSFRGCLRKLVLTKGPHTELFDFSRAFDLRGVFPHSCPGAEHWTVAKPVWIERGFFCCWSVILCSHFIMKRRTDKNLHLFDFSGCFPTQVIYFFNQKLHFN